MIPARYRFHGHGSLRYVYTHGQAIRSRLCTIKYIQNTRRKRSRIAVVVSKKVIKKAVGRNRIRRRVYELMRHRIERLDAVYDIVVIVSSPEVRDIESRELESQLDAMLHDAAVYKTSKK